MTLIAACLQGSDKQLAVIGQNFSRRLRRLKPKRRWIIPIKPIRRAQSRP
jgi:hypothetical protein